MPDALATAMADPSTGDHAGERPERETDRTEAGRHTQARPEANADHQPQTRESLLQGVHWHSLDPLYDVPVLMTDCMPSRAIAKRYHNNIKRQGAGTAGEEIGARREGRRLKKAPRVRRFGEEKSELDVSRASPE